MTREYYEMIKAETFYPVSEESYELFNDRVELHAMSNRHTEILGQFMDGFAVSEEVLKEILIEGWIFRFDRIRRFGNGFAFEK